MHENHSTMEQKKLIKVVFDLEKSDWHDHATESVWAISRGEDLYEIDNVPFYIYGISYKDTVRARKAYSLFEFQKVEKRGGHSTYRIFLVNDSTRHRFGEYWKPLEQLGCFYEEGTEILVAVDVPPVADIYKAYDALQKGETDGIWDFEEGYCGHPLKWR